MGKKKSKKREVRMSDNAKKSMIEFGLEVRDFIFGSLRDKHNITLPLIISHYATNGFKKGYEYGKREERTKLSVKKNEQTETSQYKQHVYVFDDSEGCLIMDAWVCSVPDVGDEISIWKNGCFCRSTVRNRIYGMNAEEKSGCWNLYVAQSNNNRNYGLNGKSKKESSSSD